MKNLNLYSILFRFSFIIAFTLCQTTLAQVFPASTLKSVKSLGKESDSGIHGPSYAELVKYFTSLPQKYPEQVQLFNYGMTPKKRPLIALRIAYPQRLVVTRSAVGPAMLITGATHGNEYLNIEDRLPEWFAAQAPKNLTLDSYFKTGGVVYIIPIFNPDGYDTRRRENSRGIDLNRDYTVKQANYIAFKEVETQLFRDFLQNILQKDNKRLSLTIDYHCCIGAALYPWSYRGAPELPANFLALFQDFGSVFKNFMGQQFRVGTTPKILGYSAVGTSKDYFYENYQALSFTYEGEVDEESQKFDLHTQILTQFIAKIQNLRFRQINR